MFPPHLGRFRLAATVPDSHGSAARERGRVGGERERWRLVGVDAPELLLERYSAAGGQGPALCRALRPGEHHNLLAGRRLLGRSAQREEARRRALVAGAVEAVLRQDHVGGHLLHGVSLPRRECGRAGKRGGGGG